MSSALSLDASAATWLAGLDPALTLLPHALPAASGGAQWQLHDVHWTPGEGCRLAYLQHRPNSASTCLAVEVTSAGWSQHDYRDDGSLPGLAVAADPHRVATLLERPVGEPVHGCRVEPVRYRPSSRCVLRYDIETASGHTTLYAKAFRPETFAHVSRLGAALAARTSEPSFVPEVTAVWPDLNVVVGRAIHGRAVSAILGDRAVPAGERVRLAHRLGDLLARFHAQTGVTAPRWSAEDQVHSLATSLDAVQCADARIANRLLALLDVLARAAPASGNEVLGHGAFRAGQVLSGREGRLIVLDTDGVSLCDPGRDLGTALAHLHWHGVRQRLQRQTLRGAERALLAGYESHAGAVDPQTLLWWRAAGLLQVAVRRYRRLETTAWSSVPFLADAAAGLLAARQAHLAPHGATDLLDTRQMSTVLRLALAPVAASPQSVKVESADELATSTGRRSVVLYTVRGVDGADAVPVVGKVFTEARRASLLYDHLQLLSAGPFRRGVLRVPEPLALLPEQRLVLYRSSDGVPLDRLIDPTQAEGGVRSAARWLARLHSSGIRLPRSFSLVQEEDTTRRWSALIGQLHPHLAGEARRLADRWAAATRSAGVDIELPIHKDFHAGHVLVGDEICVIDLDEARQGDPAFDVAHMATYLELSGDSRSSAASLRGPFLEEYAAASGWVDKGTYAPFCAYTWLKIAKQWAVGSGPHRESSPDRRLAGLERALRKGEECLSG